MIKRAVFSLLEQTRPATKCTKGDGTQRPKCMPEGWAQDVARWIRAGAGIYFGAESLEKFLGDEPRLEESHLTWGGGERRV